MLAPLALILSCAPTLQGGTGTSHDLPVPRLVEVDPEGRRMQQGEVLVGLERAQDRARVLAELERDGAVLLGEVPRFGLLKVTAPMGGTTPEAAGRYGDVPGVRSAEPNYLGSKAGWASNDPSFPDQWHLQNTGQNGGTPGADVEAVPAWAIEQGNDAVVVAVLDTGINPFHPEFAGRLLPGIDFFEEDDVPQADDPHGIWVAGLLAANGGNGVDGAGIDPSCTILPVRVLDDDGDGSTFDLVQGLDYCVEQQPEIVNMSLGGYPQTLALSEALKVASLSGCLLISASGNSGTGTADTSLPSASVHTVTVTATTPADQFGSFSGSGAAVDFAAPGVDMAVSGEGPGDMQVVWGTSAAAPIASGIASLLRSKYPAASNDCIFQLLRIGAEDQVGGPVQDPPGYDFNFGWGRLNALRSLQAEPDCATSPRLSANPDRLSIDEGGSQHYELDSLKEHAGLFYLLLGSTATSPGLNVDGVDIPLALDSYLLFTLGALTSGPYANAIGFLDDLSSASAALSLPAQASPGLLGIELHHAFVVLDLAGAGTLLDASNAVPLDFFQNLVHVDEDFESGAPGWTFNEGTAGLWGISADGECGVSTGSMASYSNGAPLCNYTTGGFGFSSGKLTSPEMVLGAEPIRVAFDSLPEVGSGADYRVELRDVVTGEVLEIASETDLALPGLSSFSLELDTAQPWTGRTVQVEFFFSSGFSDTNHPGWFVDNVRVTSAQP